MKSFVITSAALLLWVVGAAAIVVSTVALLGLAFDYSTGGLFLTLLVMPIALALWAGLVVQLHNLIDNP